MENIILKEKLIFYHHLVNLPSDSLAREVIDLQLSNPDTSGPNLVTEVKEYIEQLGMNPVNVSKWQWKKKIRIFIKNKNRLDLLSNIKHYKKLDYDLFCQEEFGRKAYFFDNDLDTVRTLFRLSSRMLETVRGDFPHKYRKKSLICPSCRTGDVSQRPRNQSLDEGPIDSLEHIKLDCYAFRELRYKYDLSDDKQLVKFFNSVVEQRKERGED